MDVSRPENLWNPDTQKATYPSTYSAGLPYGTKPRTRMSEITGTVYFPSQE